MSSIINALIGVGLLFGAVIAFQNRCTWFQLCGDNLFGSASATPAPATTSDTVTNNYYNEDGTVNGPAANPGLSMSGNCCECKKVGNIVKCQKNGDGNWFNPPAGPDGSNDQSVDLSLLECRKTCGSPSTTTSTPPKSTMPSNGSPESSRQNKPKTGNLGEPNVKYVAPKKVPQTVNGKPNPARYLNNNAPYKPGEVRKATYAHAYYNTIRRMQNNSCSYLSLNGLRMSI